MRVEDGVLRARVRIRTPPFARIHRLIAFHNGVAVVDLALETEAADIVDHDAVVEVPVDADGFVVFLALGDSSLAYVAPGDPVWALANPIWVDVDGDGVTPHGPGALALPDLEICR